MGTALVRTPVCFLCHRADLIALPIAAAAELVAGALVQDVLSCPAWPGLSGSS